MDYGRYHQAERCDGKKVAVDAVNYLGRRCIKERPGKDTAGLKVRRRGAKQVEGV